MTTLTAAQQDYIETLFRLEARFVERPVRVCDIAAELGTRLPTVTRTVKRLAALGLVRHAERGDVRLSPEGSRIARDIVHRHDDLVQFFTEVLGLSREEAERDACQAEHGVSANTARRLHEFLELFASLPTGDRLRLTTFHNTVRRRFADFRSLTDGKTNGWRS